MSSTRPASIPDRVETLDLLRLFAAFSVLLYHYSFRGAAGDDMTWLSVPAIAPVTKYGFFGVQLFFVISGFVISYSAAGRNVRQFAVARAARIYPGFLAGMTFSFVALLLIGAPEARVSLTQWVANLAILSPALKQPFMDGVYWSIVYELVFYVWISAAIATGLFPRRLPVIVAAWLVIALANETVLGSGIVRRLFVTDDAAFFAAGVMLYVLYSGRRSIWNWALLAAATVAAALQADWSTDWSRQHFGVPYSHIAVMAVAAGAVAMVGVALLVRRTPVPAKLALAIGGLTYPLYLIHQMVGYAIFNRLHGVLPAPILLAAVAALMLAAAWMIYRFAERPGQRLVKTTLNRILFPRGVVPPVPAVPAAPTREPVAVFGPVALPRAVRAAEK